MAQRHRGTKAQRTTHRGPHYGHHSEHGLRAAGRSRRTRTAGARPEPGRQSVVRAGRSRRLASRGLVRRQERLQPRSGRRPLGRGPQICELRSGALPPLLATRPGPGRPQVPFQRLGQDPRHRGRRVRRHPVHGVARRRRQVAGRPLSARHQGHERMDADRRPDPAARQHRLGHALLLRAQGNDGHGLVRRRGIGARRRSAAGDHAAGARLSRPDHRGRAGPDPAARPAESAGLRPGAAAVAPLGRVARRGRDRTGPAAAQPAGRSLRPGHAHRCVDPRPIRAGGSPRRAGRETDPAGRAPAGARGRRFSSPRDHRRAPPTAVRRASLLSPGHVLERHQREGPGRVCPKQVQLPDALRVPQPPTDGLGPPARPEGDLFHQGLVRGKQVLPKVDPVAGRRRGHGPRPGPRIPRSSGAVGLVSERRAAAEVPAAA